MYGCAKRRTRCITATFWSLPMQAPTAGKDSPLASVRLGSESQDGLTTASSEAALPSYKSNGRARAVTPLQLDRITGRHRAPQTGGNETVATFFSPATTSTGGPRSAPPRGRRGAGVIPACVRCGTSDYVVPWVTKNTWYCICHDYQRANGICGRIWASDAIIPLHPKPLGKLRAAFVTEKKKRQRIHCRRVGLKLESHFGVAGYACAACGKFIPLYTCRRGPAFGVEVAEGVEEDTTSSASPRRRFRDHSTSSTIIDLPC